MRLHAFIAGLAVAIAVAAIGSPSAHAETNQNDKTNDKKSTTTVKVERGDYLAKIARDQDSTYLRIFYANEEIKHPDLIYPGQELRIPSADEKLKQRSYEQPQPVAQPSRSSSTATSSSQTRRVAAETPRATGTISGSVWDRIAQCESGGNWSINTGNGYYGGLQFSLSSWRAVGGKGYPHQASKSEQIARGERLQAMQGWGAWPTCSRKAGLR